MASSVPTATSVATSTPESIVCTVNPQAVNAIFLQGTAFPGIEIPRQHITNFVQSMPSVSVQQQQPQQQQVQLISTIANASTSGITIKGQHDSIVTVVGSGGKQTKQGRQNQQNQIVHQSSSQLTGPLMTAIAFPGNPMQSHSVQQHVSLPQHSHQQITVVPTTTNNRSGIWPCPACKITFKSATELQAHLTAHTKVEKSVPCGTCGKLFASAERVRIHIRVAHGEKSCACEICGSGFSYRCKLLDHMRTHTGDKPFRCEVCSRSFSQKNHLRRHQMIHTGERPYPCEICGRGFYRKDKLSRHRKIHLTNQEKAAQSSIKSEKHSRHHNSNSTANNASATQQATHQSNLGNVVASSSQPTIIIPIVPQFANRQGTPQWVAQVGQQIVSTSMASGINVNSSTNNVTANNNDRTNSHHSPSGSPSAITGDV